MSVRATHISSLSALPSSVPRSWSIAAELLSGLSGNQGTSPWTMVVVAPLLPSFTSFFSYHRAHGVSEAPYPILRYILAEKIMAGFVKKGRRWQSPFLPWKNLYRQASGFII